METNLRLNQHQIDKQHYEIVLDVFIREALAVWALREAHAFAEGAVVGFGVCGVEGGDGVAAGDAYWHCCCYIVVSGWARSRESWRVEDVELGWDGGKKDIGKVRARTAIRASAGI